MPSTPVSDAVAASPAMPRRDAFIARAESLPGIRSVMRRFHERRFVANRDRNLFRGVFPDRQSAEASAPSARPVGYDNAESAALYLGLTEPDPYDYPAMFWLSRRIGEGVRSVFDVGGHFGMKYYAFENRIPLPPGLRWTVCDVPAVVQRGRAIAAKRDASRRLAFTESYRDVDGFDLLFASGVLQYLPMTLAEWLATIPRRPRHLVVNTTPLHPALGFFTLNSIGTAFCPYRVQKESEFFDALAELGYRRVDRWLNPGKSMRIPTLPEHSLRDYVGAVLELDPGGV
jgi:putative methyltransferase (TIGR04325 family)